MGFISDFLGGKKAPAPPGQLRESAEASYELAEGFRPRVNQYAGFADDYINNHLPGYSEQVAGDFDSARRNASQFSDDYAGLFAGSGLGVLQQAGDDALMAGSPGRQNDEARRAWESGATAIDAAKMGRMDEMRRRGRFGGGSDSPHLAVLEGLGLGKAANDARLQERNYGMAFRQGFVPTAMNFGRSAVGYGGQAGQLSRMAADGRMMVPQQAGALYQGQGALTGQSQGHFGNAQGMFGNSYRADLMKTQADNARQQAIIGNVVRIGSAIASGGMSEAAGGFGGGGGGGSGGAGGGGGGFLSSVGNWFKPAAQTQGRHSFMEGSGNALPVDRTMNNKMQSYGWGRPSHQWGWG